MGDKVLDTESAVRLYGDRVIFQSYYNQGYEYAQFGSGPWVTHKGLIVSVMCVWMFKHPKSDDVPVVVHLKQRNLGKKQNRLLTIYSADSLVDFLKSYEVTRGQELNLGNILEKWPT